MANKWQNYQRFEVRVLIAKHLGYRVIDLNDNPHGAIVKGPNWVLLNPTGQSIHHAFSMADAWNGAPDFPNSLDAAWTLPIPSRAKELRSGLAIWQQGEDWIANYAGAMVYGDYAGVTSNPAFSVCCSWLAYTEGVL